MAGKSVNGVIYVIPLISKTFAPIHYINNPASAKTIFFQQVLHGQIVPMCICTEVGNTLLAEGQAFRKAALLRSIAAQPVDCPIS